MDRRLIAKAVALVLAVGFSSNVFAGQTCVQYVKAQKPGGFTWNKPYSLLDSKGKPVVANCTTYTKQCVAWSPAMDLWKKLATASRGQAPKVGSVLVMDANPSSSVGHVAIVTAVSSDGKTVTVTHANWESAGQVSGGQYVLDGKGRAKYITSKGVKWSTSYPILGFVYQP